VVLDIVETMNCAFNQTGNIVTVWRMGESDQRSGQLYQNN